MIPFWLIILILLWFVVPAYISWKYDTSPREVIRCVSFAIVGDFEQAKSYMVLKEDPVKPLFWYHWIPIVGRFYIHFRDLRMHPDLRRELWISLVENTAMYFVVGTIGGYYFDFNLFLGVLTVTFFIIVPIEYKLTILRPKLFLSDGEIDYVEYLCVFLHAYYFAIVGAIFLNGVR